MSESQSLEVKNESRILAVELARELTMDELDLRFRRRLHGVGLR